jgi:hypothetical protein
MYHSVCPLVRLWTPPPLFPPEPKGGGGTQGGEHTRLRVRGWGSLFEQQEKKLSNLSTLCRKLQEQKNRRGQLMSSLPFVI